MYYRGAHGVYKPGKCETLHQQVTCYAESTDGIHWTKPDRDLSKLAGTPVRLRVVLKDADLYSIQQMRPVDGDQDPTH